MSPPHLPGATEGQKNQHKKCDFNKSQIANIEEYIKKNKLPFNALKLIKFIRTSIAEREKSNYFGPSRCAPPKVYEAAIKRRSLARIGEF